MLDGSINAKRPFAGKRVIAENYRYVALATIFAFQIYTPVKTRVANTCLNRPIFAISAKRESLSAIDWQ